jgi:taurine dioxygenase
VNHIWHSDGGFRADAPAFTALFAQQLPDSGGDTIFSNAAWVYEQLDPLFARYLESLTVVQSADATGHITERYLDPQEATNARMRMPPFEMPGSGSSSYWSEVDRGERILCGLYQGYQPRHEPKYSRHSV